MRILFVCTGNMCRSPVAERLAAAWAADLLSGSPELTGVHITSAGLEAVEGRPMDPHSAAALARLGGDPAGFGAQPFTADLAEQADLVFTMTRRQRRTVLESMPRGLRRTFTLAEAADLLPRAETTGLALTPLGERARELGRRLDAARAGRTLRDGDDIDDPIGRKAADHDAAAEAIAVALRPVAAVLFTSVRQDLAVLAPA